MKTSAMLSLLLATAASPAFATPEYLSVKEIAEITGMKPAEVQLMVGSYSNNPLYRTSLIRVSNEWRQALAENDLILVATRAANGQVAYLVCRAEKHNEA